MTRVLTAPPSRDGSTAGALLVAGIVLATLTEAIASTVLSLGRADIIGDTYATPDEFAWLDIGYTALKLIGFIAAPGLMNRVRPLSLIIGATLAMGMACGIAAVTARLDLLVALRIIQGFAGGILLVGGQAIIFLAYPRSRQPILQALFAMGSVVAPATIAPALQGWLIDSQSWTWIFFSVVPLALAAAGLLLIADGPMPTKPAQRPFDWIGFSLICVTLFCFTYVLSQGSRWDWFEEPRILWLTVIGAATLLAFLGQQALAKGEGLLDFTLFQSDDFCFALIVSFVAGAALFGSAFLIPSFAVSVLAFTPTDAGQLLLPSGALFVGALLLAAFLMQVRRVPPFATVPFGILMIMVAMWMLSGSTSESGADDMMAAILLRGLGLGFLFLSITLIAFGNLNNRNLASGIGLFNTGRQLGGLIGVAALQTLIDHNVVANVAVLGANVTAGGPAVIERLATTTAMLTAKGMDAAAAGRAATSLLGRVVTGQSTVIAFDTAFNAVALLFVIAAPILVAIKIGLAKVRAARLLKTKESRENYAAFLENVRQELLWTAVRTGKYGGRAKERSINPCLLLLIFALLMPCQPALAQTDRNPVGQPTSVAALPPEDLRQLLDLLQRPDIQTWLQSQTGNRPVEEQSSAEAANAREIIVGRLNAVRSFVHDMATAIPTLPAELHRARVALMTEMRGQGSFAAILPLVFFATLGFGLEWLYWHATSGFRDRMIVTHLDTVDDRLRAAGLRILYGLGVLLAFAVGSVGAFLLFDWPPLLQHSVLAYLLVFLAVRLTLVVGRIVLAPGAERFRLMPVATVTARFWFFWSAVLVGLFAFGHFTYQLLPMLGVGHEATYIVALASGLILFGLALVALWRCPTFDGVDMVSRRHRVSTVLGTLYIIANWLVALSGVAATFYIGVVLLVLPIAISCVRLSIDHIMRPPGTIAANEGVPSLAGAALERGLRSLLLIGGAYLIASLLGLDFGTLAARDTMATHLIRGLLNAFVVILLADFTWRMTSTWIDRKLMQTAVGDAVDPDELRRSARLRTLLPVLRNVLFVVLLAMAILMALSSLGVEIGPLIAGAGVVGLAVGFGAQTLVKDIISGMFFLLDDAFRVGEYIESGSIKGTVESFSLRSIKIRHHRGGLHTIPFGSLDKITNYSRDWAIDKIMVSVTYNTDLDVVKNTVKQVGKQLLTDEEIAPSIMETLKMQGVEQFGDFAIQIRMKIMTKPGEQAVIRRRAYALIKKAFDAKGIKFAVPTVSVAGGGDASSAVAQKGLDLIKPPPQTEQAALDA